MESNAGAVATEPAPVSRPSAAPAPASATTALAAAAAAIHSDDGARVLKRQREATPPSPRSLTSHQISSLGSPAKSARLALATGRSPPPPLTGAAALEDERRRREAERAATPPPSSENPSHRVLASLMPGDERNVSRPSDAPQPAPTATMEEPARPTNTLSIPSDTAERSDDRDDISPQSNTSMAGIHVTASPTSMDVDPKDDSSLSQQVAGQGERLHPSSLSYPGSLASSANMAEPTPRGMSFPIPQGQTSPSSGNKKHKCPYCNTEFTRHHNLKSHLLTHSQEKPYVCTECPLRFRRLHDLKRHGKLHTGEKPHICPKCDRKFARGDALARHSKGAGGCAGRRSSMGSFADGDELDGHTLGEGEDSTMSGIGYENGEEDELRRQSLPTVNAHHVSGSENESYSAHSRTYPPARPGGSGLYPPSVNQNQANSTAPSSATNHTPNTSLSSAQVSGGSAGMYSQSGMTESPKALSPGVQGLEPSNASRQRSPGLTQQLQQQQLGQRPPDLQSPNNRQSQPKLPGLSHPGFSATSPGSTYSHGRRPSGNQPSSDSRNMFAQNESQVWAYIQALEDKVKTLTDKVSALDDEMTSLRSQVADRESGSTAPREQRDGA